MRRVIEKNLSAVLVFHSADLGSSRESATGKMLRLLTNDRRTLFLWRTYMPETARVVFRPAANVSGLILRPFCVFCLMTQASRPYCNEYFLYMYMAMYTKAPIGLRHLQQWSSFCFFCCGHGHGRRRLLIVVITVIITKQKQQFFSPSFYQHY